MAPNNNKIISCNHSKLKIFKNITPVIILLLISLFFISCSHKKATDIEQAGLKGSVKSIREVTYQASGTIDTVVKGDIVMSEDIQNYYVKYTSFGNISDMYSYDNTGALLFHWHYTYDDEQQTLYGNYYLSDSVMLDSTYYVYDNKGNIKEYYHYDANGKLKNKIVDDHDSKGNIVEEKMFNNDNLVIRTTKCKYKHRNVKENASYDTDGHLLYYTHYEYDSYDNMTSQTIFNADSTINSKGLYRYNEHGDCIESITQVPKAKDIKYSYSYKYDKRNNWTQKITLLNNQVILLTIRDVTYY